MGTEGEECSKMDEENWEVLGKVTNSPKLKGEFKKIIAESKEEGNVCRALQEFYDDGIAEGKAEGKAIKLYRTDL